MSEKLKLCPFCGGEVKGIYFSDGVGTEYFGVHCERCRFTYAAETEYKRNTVNRWNRRTTGWIRTSEKLPGENEVVFLYVKNSMGWYLTVGYLEFNSDGDSVCIIDNGYDWITLDEVFCWMPIPDLPEVEE